jgi:hypothetical protein
MAEADDPVAGIGRLDLLALCDAWAGLFGRPPPKGVSRRLLEYAAAYHMQAQRHGGLKPALRRKLLQSARPSSGDQSGRRHRPGPLAPGSRLVRDWHGRCHTVEVVEHGFLYAGRR